MTRNKPWTAVSKALVAVTVMLIVTLVLASGTAAASTNPCISSRAGRRIPWEPDLDAAGNLYGTTEDGPGGSVGAAWPVYKLAPSANGTWKVSTSTLYGHGWSQSHRRPDL